jgi:hypothetical protein
MQKNANGFHEDFRSAAILSLAIVPMGPSAGIAHTQEYVSLQPLWVASNNTHNMMRCGMSNRT